VPVAIKNKTRVLVSLEPIKAMQAIQEFIT
jgi:hypothetical protein